MWVWRGEIFLVVHNTLNESELHSWENIPTLLEHRKDTDGFGTSDVSFEYVGLFHSFSFTLAFYTNGLF